MQLIKFIKIFINFKILFWTLNHTVRALKFELCLGQREKSKNISKGSDHFRMSHKLKTYRRGLNLTFRHEDFQNNWNWVISKKFAISCAIGAWGLSKNLNVTNYKKTLSLVLKSEEQRISKIRNQEKGNRNQPFLFSNMSA